MAFYLRDQHVVDLTISVGSLTELNQVFEARRGTMPDLAPDEGGQANFLTYIIRFDDKGYRVFTLQELLAHYQQARHIDRVIFTLESARSLRNNRNTGSFMELFLDRKDPNNCFLKVTSDDEGWVGASFAAVNEALAKFKNKNGWMRGAWTQLVIQLLGILTGFFLSTWGATKIAPQLSIANAFLISFFLVLIVCSNLWFFVNQRLYALVVQTFPVVRFYRPQQDKMHWLLQAVIGGVVVAVTLYLINVVFAYAGQVLGSLVEH